MKPALRGRAAILRRTFADFLQVGFLPRCLRADK
jgi:hypothetical protein